MPLDSWCPEALFLSGEGRDSVSRQQFAPVRMAVGYAIYALPSQNSLKEQA